MSNGRPMNNDRKLSFKDLKKQMKTTAYYSKPNDFGVEGEDHINISIQSETRLGKILDPAYLKSINYRFIGKFASVMSLWYWVRSPDFDDRLRQLTGRNLKMYADQNGLHNNYVPNFKAIIGMATWQKIKGYPAILKEIKELKEGTKLLSYHVVKASDLRVCTHYAEMIIKIGNIIVDSVKAGAEPDFSELADDKSKTGLMFMEGVLIKLFGNEQKVEALKEAEAKNAAEAESVPEDDYEEIHSENSQHVEQEHANPQVEVSPA